MITVAHVVYGFDIGGLENVIVQLINRLPVDRYRHVLISLTLLGECTSRIVTPGVEMVALNKKPGHAIPLYPKLFRLFRRYRPDVLHTCNLAALEVVPVAWAAGVRCRVHAEHGWDASDPRGQNPHYQRLRRLYRPFVSRYVSVSRDLDQYLADSVNVPDSLKVLIPNGVDTDVFTPSSDAKPPALACGMPQPMQHWIVGTVGRLQTVKNQPLLAKAFVRFLQLVPEARSRARLVIVGEGPLRQKVEAILKDAGLSDLAWLPGTRSDIPDVLRALDVFVLPSQTEGTSCTLQEAMATGLPSICTAVGGTPDVLQHGEHGFLVPSEDVEAMAEALKTYWTTPALALAHGVAARKLAVARFGLDAMVQQYDAVFSAHNKDAHPPRP